MTGITVESNLPDIQAALERMLAEIPARTEATITNLAPAIKELVQGVIEAHTPYAEHEGGDESKHLRDTTTGEIVPSVDSTELVFRQTKTVPWRGHEDIVLADLLTQGRSGGYEVKPLRPAYALFWPGLEHPVGISHPGPAAPNPYIAEAMVEATPAVERVLDAVGANLAFEILEVMRA